MTTYNVNLNIQSTSLRDGLEGLTGDDRLSANAIKGLTTSNYVNVLDFGAVADGITDNADVIQSVIDTYTGLKIILIGNSLNDVFIISRFLTVPSNCHIIINGQIKQQDSNIRLLTANLGNGTNIISVADANLYFKVGQKIVVTDDAQPINGGGAWKTRRVGQTNIIASLTSTQIVCQDTFSNWLNGGVTTAQNARVGLANSIFVVEDQASNIIFEGSGIIDGNLANSLNIAGADFNRTGEDLKSACGISLDRNSTVFIGGNLTIQNCVLHGVATNRVVHLGINTTFLKIRGLTIDGCVDKSIAGINLTDSDISFVYAKNGIDEGEISLYNNCKRINITNCIVENNRRYGIGIIAVDNAQINVDNIIFRQSATGSFDFYIQNQVNGINYSNLQFEGAGSASGCLVVTNSDKVFGKNVVFLNKTAAGLSSLYSVTSDSQDVHIDGIASINSCPSTTSGRASFVFAGQKFTFSNFTIETTGRVFDFESTAEGLVENGNITGATNLFADNLGDVRISNVRGQYRFENQSNATIKSGQTSVIISHGLNITPLIRDFTVVPTKLSNANKFWVSDITVNSFKINVDVDPGVNQATFTWKIEAYRGSLTAEPNYTTTYQSNFSAGVDGWTAANGTVLGNQDGISGVDDTLLYYANAANNTHYAQKTSVLSTTLTNRVRIQYFIPNTNTTLKGIRISNLAFVSQILEVNQLGVWRELITAEFISTNTTLIIQGTTVGGGNTFIGANSPTNDQIYLKNVIVEQR